MYEAGSMSVIWGWFLTTFFTIIVAMSLAEICSAYPTTGGLYFWTSRLATSEWVPLACWLTGWANWMGLACKYLLRFFRVGPFLAIFTNLILKLSRNHFRRSRFISVHWICYQHLVRQKPPICQFRIWRNFIKPTFVKQGPHCKHLGIYGVRYLCRYHHCSWLHQFRCCQMERYNEPIFL